MAAQETVLALEMADEEKWLSVAIAGGQARMLQVQEEHHRVETPLLRPLRLQTAMHSDQWAAAQPP